MNLLFAFLRLIRWKNLLIVALTQFMVWYFVIYPIEDMGSKGIFLTVFNFSLLCFSTVLIAAAGYIINDYFDVEIDLINKPKNVIIEKFIAKKNALLGYVFFNLFALCIAFFLAWKLQQLYLVFIQVVCVVLLWLYSTKFKREFMKGNILVAFLVAFTILILAAYEPAVYHAVLLHNDDNEKVNPFIIIVVYAYFAFMITWMREIVKDMEDFKGDSEVGCVTMPIKIGLQKSQRFVSILGFLGIVPLLIVSFKLMQDSWYVLSLYILIALVIPIAYLIFYLPQKTSQAHYHRVSKMLKLIMIAGLMTMIIYRLLQNLG